MKLESINPQASRAHLDPQTISQSSIDPHTTSHDQGASSHILIHDESCLSSSSLYAGRQVHRHGDKNPTSNNV